MAQESWWFPVQPPQQQQHHHRHAAARADSSDTASMSSRGRCDSGGSTPGEVYSDALGEPSSSSATTTTPTTTVVLPSSRDSGGGGRRRTRKRDWFKVLLAARNLATVVYAISYTTTLPVLPFMVNRLIYPREAEGPDDPGSDGVPEAWRGMAYGLVMSGYYLTKMISAPWIGFLSDRMGRRQALVVTLLGGALSFLVTKLWGQYSIQGLILCRLLMGCFAANGALMHAYIRDTVSRDRQTGGRAGAGACCRHVSEEGSSTPLQGVFVMGLASRALAVTVPFAAVVYVFVMLPGTSSSSVVLFFF